MIVAIHQPNFFPWLGYFVKICRADQFILLDNVSFSKGSFINRVRVKYKGDNETWLTVPVEAHPLGRRLDHIHLAKNFIARMEILNKLTSYYCKSPFKKPTLALLDRCLSTAPTHSLAAFNEFLIREIADILMICTHVRTASSLNLPPLKKDDLNVGIVKAVGGSTYLAGVGARESYMKEEVYCRSGISIIYNDIVLPEYPQTGTEFVPNLSVLDALFNIGPAATATLIRGAAAR